MYQTTASVVKVNENNIKEKAENGRRASKNKITPTIRHVRRASSYLNKGETTTIGQEARI